MTRRIFRTTLVDTATADAGQQLAESAAAESENAKRDNSRSRRASAAAAQIGMRVRPGVRSEEQIAALNSIAQRAERDASEAPEGDTSELKQYVIQTAPLALTPAQKNAIYFQLWGEVEKAKPGVNRPALTQKTLGFVKPIGALSEDEFARVMHVLKAIARDAA